MIKVNRPNDTIFMGRVKTIRNGLRRAFRMPRAAAARMAERKPLTNMPSIVYDAKIMETVRMSHRIKIPAITSFYSYAGCKCYKADI